MCNRIRGLAFAAFACTATLLAACSASQQATSPQDPFNWAVTQQVQSPDGKAVAVLETGKSNTGARTAPLHRISIQTVGSAEKWGNHWTVWQSQVNRLPAIAWSSPSRLVITQEPHLVIEYEPEVTIEGRAYTVDVSIHRDGP